mmetsp:Transcript_40550/g.82911  ORF Transcript_40550/g.82911 Transcript_40550/m.82911 type:complete len:116 (-) Transcript_40550:1132-1479(-)
MYNFVEKRHTQKADVLKAEHAAGDIPEPSVTCQVREASVARCHIDSTSASRGFQPPYPVLDPTAYTGMRQPLDVMFLHTELKHFECMICPDRHPKARQQCVLHLFPRPSFQDSVC